MDPLITIETVPIKIEYTKNESAQTSARQSAKLNISKNDDSVMIQSDPISIPVTDTFEFRPSVDLNHLTYTATARYSGRGNLTMNIQLQDTDKTYQYQQFGRGIDNIVNNLPSGSNNSDVQNEDMRINFDMSQYFAENGSNENSVNTSFYPPDLEFKVVERAKVIVKYVGGPIYVPPSADPEYDAEKAPKIAYFPESANPNYKPDSFDESDEKIKLDLRA